MIPKKQKRMEYKNLSERVYEIIRDMITTRELRSRERIVEEELAKKLGVSRTPIKRALAKLNEEGLVKVVPRQGTYVEKFSLKDALSIYDAREVLEGLAARLAASSITDKQVKEMREIFRNAEDFIEKKDFDAYIKADIKFHGLLAQASGNKIISQIIANFHLRINSFNVGLIRSPSETLKEHLSIIDALSKHESDLAEKLIREHIKTSREKLLSKSQSR